MPGRERGKGGARRSNPLGDDLHASRYAQAKKTNKSTAAATASDDATGDVHSVTRADAQGFVLPTRTTQRILRTARDQLEQVDAEQRYSRHNNDNDNDEEEATATAGGAGVASLHAALEGRTGRGEQYEHDDDDDDEDAMAALEYDDDNDDDDKESVMTVPSSETGDHGAATAVMYGIDEAEARLLQKFQPTSRVQSRNLADLITEKIREHEGGEHGRGRSGGGEAGGHDTQTASSSAGHHHAGDEEASEHIDARVARVYTAIGSVLRRYTSGKVPKAFKILPHVRNWEQLLMLTQPAQWSPHAAYQATRLFTANANEAMAQRFYAAVLLPIVHARMSEERKLHPSLYMAVRKALYKPVAFFKGFLLPLACDDECTLREALVVASVLQRSHLPPVPTAVTIVKLSQLPFAGPRAVFLRVLIDKKMALPYQAIDALVAYFHRFTRTHSSEEALPVLWHQTLLSFAQRYKLELTAEQLTLLQQVCAMHFHYLITPETRRELQHAVTAAASSLSTLAATATATHKRADVAAH